jgi:hypothetical protein
VGRRFDSSILLPGYIRAYLRQAQHLRNPQHGHEQTYEVRLGHLGNRWYVDFWLHAVYCTIDTISFTMLAIVALYVIGRNLWVRYGR